MVTRLVRVGELAHGSFDHLEILTTAAGAPHLPGFTPRGRERAAMPRV
jgi:hypothetical protein